MIGAQIARAGEEVYGWLLGQERGRGAALPVRVGDVDEWLKLYRQHRWVLQVRETETAQLVTACRAVGQLVGGAGIEPATPGFSVLCSTN